MRIIAKEDDEKTAEKDKQRGAGRVGDLQFVTAGDELSAIPEAACSFHCHYKDGTGNQSHNPTHDVVRAIKIHNWVIVFGRTPRGSGAGKYKVLFNKNLLYRAPGVGVHYEQVNTPADRTDEKRLIKSLDRLLEQDLP